MERYGNEERRRDATAGTPRSGVRPSPSPRGRGLGDAGGGRRAPSEAGSAASLLLSDTLHCIASSSLLASGRPAPAPRPCGLLG
jgi:hypothetical protein